jgi:hypothetical protein
MWNPFTIKRTLEEKIASLANENQRLETELFQSQQFERIVSEKLEVWVKKHDDLLVEYKKLTKPRRVSAKRK